MLLSLPLWPISLSMRALQESQTWTAGELCSYPCRSLRPLEELRRFFSCRPLHPLLTLGLVCLWTRLASLA